MKNLPLAYVFFFFGGICGFHLLYLGRLKHFICFFSTFCGCFGTSLIYDFFYLPYYVQEANFGAEFQRDWHTLKSQHKRPPISFTKLIAQFVVGNVWEFAVVFALPAESSLLQWLGPLACSLGIYIVGNIGLETGDLLIPTLAAYVPAILLGSPKNSLILVSISSCVAYVVFSRRWKSEMVSEVTLVNYLWVLLTLIICANSVTFLFNGIKNFILSAQFTETETQTFSIQDSIDRALKILNLGKQASCEAIYKKKIEIAKRHPDMIRDKEKEPDGRFSQLWDAYKLLSCHVCKVRKHCRGEEAPLF